MCRLFYRKNQKNATYHIKVSCRVCLQFKCDHFVTHIMVQKKKRNSRPPPASKELLFKDDDQYYAHILKALGDRRFSMLTDTGTEIIGKLRGSMRRREFVMVGSTVLCSLRPEERKADILHKYTDTHVKLLRKYGELESLYTQVAIYRKEHDIVTHVQEDMEDDLVQFEDDVDAIIENI